jgi:VWFA-related protein
MPAQASSPAARRAGSLWRLALAASLAFGAARPRAQQSQAQQKKSEDEEVVSVRSHLVNVDVTVKDKKGNYVNDLKAEDFAVFENGIRQKVEFFNPPLVRGASLEADGAARETAQPDAAETRARAPGALGGNVISLVLDGLTTDAANMKHVREGAIKYIREQVTGDDAVALFAVTGGLQLLQPFTHDKDKLLAAVDRASAVSTSSKNFEQRDIEENIARLREASNGADTVNTTSATSQAGAEQALAAMTAARVLQQYLRLRSVLGVQESRPILAALAAICEAQRTLPGKKTLVLFSQGFVTPEALDWQVQSMIDLANRANVAIYVIDSAGLKASAPQSGSYAPPSPLQGISGLNSRTESRGRAEGGENEFDYSRFEGNEREHDVLYRISGDTGGKFLKGTNDIGKGLARIDEEIRARYTLAYQSTDPNFDGSYRKLKIEVKRPDTQVVARPGYYAIAPDQVVPLSPEEKQLLAGIGSPASASTLPLFMGLSSFRSQGGRYVVPLALEVPHDAVKFEPKEGKRRMQLDVLVVVRAGKDEILSRLGGNFDVALNEEQYQSILANNVFYRQDVELAPGAYDVDVVVRDRLSGKTAARRERLVLPEAGADFSMTDAVLSRHVEPVRATPPGTPGNVLSHGGALISPLPSRQFGASDNLIIFFDLYNAATDKATGKPRVNVTVTLLKDGRPAIKPIAYELSDVSADPVPHLTFAKYITLNGLAPGSYTATIEATDSVAHKTVKQQASFAVTK